MLRIRIIGLALMAVFAVSVVAVSSAAAEENLPHEWLLNGKLIASPVTIHSLGLFLLEDTGTGVRIHCHGYDSGTVGPHELDLIETITAELLGTNDLIPCTFDKTGACKSGTTPKALAVHLPWHTEIYLEGTEVRDMVTEDGNGAPGWSVTCTNILGGTTTDTCTIALGSTALENVTGGVDAIFEKKSPKANCSLGGNGAGLVEGTDFNESPPGATLTFH